MDDMKKYHNVEKKLLILQYAKQRSVLDLGAGFGGDLQKWKHCQVKVDMCDPRLESLAEAQKRAEGLHMKVDFFEGDISSCPNKMYDIICYNFSLHYIFRDRDFFFQSLREIRNRMKPGSKLIGCIPDSESLLMSTPFRDNLGNTVLRGNSTGDGNFGEKVFVFLADTPFYREGPKSEPIAYKDLLITHLAELGIQKTKWEPLGGDFDISKLYSTFIFVCV
jgi:SAM-dependent methyltransferase